MQKELIKNEKLMLEWHYEKNNNLNIFPEKLTTGSTKKVWWICEKGHEWEATPNNRTRGTGCPYCSNRKILKGYNDLATTNPILLDEWNYEKNKGIHPNEIGAGSHNKVWWKCHKCGFEWETAVHNRTSGKNCPKCSLIIQGKTKIRNKIDKEGSFSDKCPQLLNEWNYEKNKNINPNEISANTHQSVWWICSVCSFEWQSSISKRTTRNQGCPKCKGTSQTSFSEQAIYYYFKNFIESETTSRFLIDGYEIDIYLPLSKIAIEYDGQFYHKGEKSNQKELKKYQYLKSKNIRLIRVKENEKDKNQNADYTLYSNYDVSGKNLSATIIKLINLYYNITLKKNIVDVNVCRDRNKIYEQYILNRLDNSLEYTNKQLTLEWHPQKNGKLLPSNFSKGSGVKVWWICPKGHEYEMSISARTSGKSCPYCSNKKVLEGYNDLATTNPELLKYWDYIKNNGITPEIVTYGSGIKVWWLCSSGHSFEARIVDRVKREICPYCTNKKVLKGYNDLATTNPKLLDEWNYNKNNIYPEMVTINSGKKVWWKCKKGHEWEASIDNRTKGTGCPYCSNKKILKGYNDLTTTNPELIKEWNFEKNKDIQPTEIGSGSHSKVWWKCHKCGFEWKTAIYNRAYGKGCIECYKKRRKKDDSKH